jgi:outer membrane protein OmpA-like peptidoglycan-associated protein
MRYSTSAAVVSAAMLASVVPAHAQTFVTWGGPPANWQGPYGGLNLGADWGTMPGNVTIFGNPVTGAGPSSNALVRHSDTTVTGGAQGGYNFQFNNFVFGLEGDIKGGGPSLTTRVISAPAGSGFAAGDRFNVGSDFNASIRGRVGYAWDQFLLYATGGVAFADTTVQANFVPTTTAGGAALPGHSNSNSTTLIGPTVGGGLEYAVTPNISIAAEYRYSDYGSDHLRVGPATTSPGVNVPAVARVSLFDNVALLKVNYRFGAPPPPPPMPVAAPAPPPPAAPKVFIVFFDWDKDTITPEGHQIIAQAADAYKSGAPVQLQVTGYTDRSGSPAYNQRLSERRANNVARALVQLGVPQNQMVVTGRGENDNRVPTAAGVREPQNRRVEITTP